MTYLRLVFAENKRVLLILFLFALAIRLSFSFYFQQFYFGQFTFEYKDTPGYLLPVINLLEHGTYIGDYFIKDSMYFRVPVYPFFLGIIHSIVGQQYLYYSVAIVQSILDSFSTVIVFLIALKITRNAKHSLYVSSLYALYPFVILWTPISYTEILEIFIMWLLIYLTINETNPPKTRNIIFFWQGILLGILILTKQYMGLLILFPVISVILSNYIIKQKTVFIFFIMAGICLSLSPWVVRNYVSSQSVIVLRGETMGVRNALSDLEAFEKFANLFDENITPAMFSVAYKGEMEFNKHLDFVNAHRTSIDIAIKKAHQCGPSFLQLRKPISLDLPPYQGCEVEVASLFKELSQSFWREMPILDAMETRFDAAKKILFKSEIVNKDLRASKSQILTNLLFKYRVILLCVGFLGIILYSLKKKDNYLRPQALAILISSMAWYLYWSIMAVHAEMRYMLTPDLLFSTLGIAFLLNTISTKGKVTS
jgi:hypothetical protein